MGGVVLMKKISSFYLTMYIASLLGCLASIYDNNIALSFVNLILSIFWLRNYIKTIY